MSTGPRPRYRLLESAHNPVVQLHLGDELIASVPIGLTTPRAARAKARRLAEDHAGHELDWRKDPLFETTNTTWFVTWSAPAVETYFPQPNLWEDLAS